MRNTESMYILGIVESDLAQDSHDAVARFTQVGDRDPLVGTNMRDADVLHRDDDAVLVQHVIGLEISPESQGNRGGISVRVHGQPGNALDGGLRELLGEGFDGPFHRGPPAPHDA